MGRVLSYSIKKESGNFTQKEHQILLDVSNKFNSVKFAEVWTCESFYLSAFDYYLNWEKFKNAKTGAWKEINKREKELTGLNQISVSKQLHKEGLILFHSNPNTNKINGFTKTQGNEFNSLLIYLALIEISTKLPKYTINLSDEGEFLYCDVKIKNGKASPQVNEIKKNVQHWLVKLVDYNELDLVFNNLPEQLINDLQLSKSPYNKENAISYIQRELNNLSELYKAIKPHFKHAPFIYNIAQEYFDPLILCRPVKIKDFINYEGGASKLMDGFNGEYFGLSQGDSEKDSYNMIAMIQSAFGDKGKLEILPKI